jgi:uncharacterized protein YllA (UPF0747 family)
MSRAVDVVPYETLQQPLSPFFLDYLAGRAKVAPFLRPGGFEPDAIASAAQAVGDADRTAVAQALARQQEARGAQEAAARAARLAAPGAAAIVTGQQAGLFGGPLFVLWKALGTVVVARELEARRGRPVVPVFWVASDDHDFAEVRSATVVDTRERCARCATTRARSRSDGPPGTSRSTRRWAASSTSWRARCRSARARRDARDRRVRYRAGETLSSAFARLVSRLLPELVVLDPADSRAQAAGGPGARPRARRSSPSSKLRSRPARRCSRPATTSRCRYGLAS